MIGCGVDALHGTLRANAANATFVQGLTNAYINAGGATIDSNGFDITVAQPLLAPAGSGVSDIALGAGGAGYVDSPLVTVTGGVATFSGLSVEETAEVLGVSVGTVKNDWSMAKAWLRRELRSDA